MPFRIKDLENNKSSVKSLNRQDNSSKDNSIIEKDLGKEPKAYFKESDIEEFKYIVETAYNDSIEGYSKLAQKYNKEFKAPSLYFDLKDSYKTAFGLIDDSKLSSKVLGAYDTGLNRVVIKPGLLYKYIKNKEKPDAVEHTVAHEVAHSIVFQLGLTKSSNYEGKKGVQEKVKNELLANLFAAELRVKKKGMPLSNEAIAKQLIEDNSDLLYLSNDIDATKIYLNDFKKYSKDVQKLIKHFSDVVYKLIKQSNKDGKAVDYDALNDYYSDKVDKVLKEYLTNMMGNYAVPVYSAPVLGAAKALLGQRKSIDAIIDSASKDLSSIKEIKRYLKGSFASVNLMSISLMESDFVKLIPPTVITESLKEDGISFSYEKAFSKISDKVENEFKRLNYYMSENLKSEKKLLRDLSRLEKSFGIIDN